MGLAVFLHLRGYRRSPGIVDPRRQFLHIDDAVPGPVDHILGGHHSQSLDPFVGVVRIRSLLITLLLVVCGIHIQSAFILDCSRVGSEVEVDKRVGKCLFKFRSSCPVSGQDSFGCLLCAGGQCGCEGDECGAFHKC